MSALFHGGGDDVPLIKPRKLPDGELDITPMIDVTFLLLIFFMVASKMEGGKTTDVPEARYGVGVEAKQATILTIKAAAAGGGRPQILNDGGIEIDFEGVRSLVRERKAAGRSQVVIKAERHVLHGFVQEVTRAVQETEGVQFYIGVTDK